jgi:hypothetical protein
MAIFVGRAPELHALDERLAGYEDHLAQRCVRLVEELARRAEARGFIKGDNEKNVVAGTRLERAVVAEIMGAASGNAAKKADGAALWARLGAPGG